MDPVRTRIAPSPSGFLHIGTAKTALYNWLLARKTGGQFILRLEDTDAERTDEQYVQGMCEGFRWLGIEWDEGPEFGGEEQRGDYGPYRQSQRRERHQREAQQLVDAGKAYRCFYTKEDLAGIREAGKKVREVSKWRCASPADVAAMGDAPYVVRFRVPDGETVIRDIIQGDVRVQNTEYDDFVILKANGDPIFHLAVVADDAAMKVTHIIRGDDHLTNAARHVMLFAALGYELPVFAHHPLVHDEQGKKFSKRLHGANVLDWRDDGYLPETIINYIALLGWTSDEENREFYTLGELIEKFTIDRIGKSPARFDRKKLDWLNGQHIRMLSREELKQRLLPILEKAGFDPGAKSPAWLNEMVEICREKLPTLNHIVELTDFFFREVTEYDEKGVKKQFAKEDSVRWLELAKQAMEETADWNRDALHGAFEKKAEANELGFGKLVNPARLALTGKPVGPGFFELVELLGRETSLARMNRAIAWTADRAG
jgi:glutamyl-tRNA synthetase